MARKYDLNQRYWGGSGEPRLNPECVDPRLNTRLRPTWPRPMVHATSQRNCIQETADSKRRLDHENTMLPGKFRK
jgi:hypothetical protein